MVICLHLYPEIFNMFLTPYSYIFNAILLHN